MATVVPWKLKEAQDLIGAMRTKVNQYGYEITIGGGVLLKGESKNDLDLFFVPKGNVHPSPVEMLIWLGTKFGLGKTIIPAAIPAGQPIPPANSIPKSAFLHKMRFDLAGRKIDVFVI